MIFWEEQGRHWSGHDMVLTSTDLAFFGLLELGSGWTSALQGRLGSGQEDLMGTRLAFFDLLESCCWTGNLQNAPGYHWSGSEGDLMDTRRACLGLLGLGKCWTSDLLGGPG